MIPYCIYCNLPIKYEKFLDLAKSPAILICSNCNVDYIWVRKSNEMQLIMYYFDFVPKASFTVYIPVNDEPIVCHLTIQNLNAYNLPEDYIYLPLNKLKDKLIKLLPFI